MTPEALLALGGAGLVLSLLAVLIDRMNFPQRRFRPRKVAYDARGPHRDRTGAHVLDDEPPPPTP